VAIVRERLPHLRATTGSTTPALAGLVIAWGGTALLVSPLAHCLGKPSQLALALVGQALFWALVAIVLAIVLCWEQQPLGSLWLKPFRWSSIGWGLLLVAVYYAMLFPWGEWVRQSASISGFGRGMNDVIKFPLWYRVVAVLGAGIGEEILFRGFSVTRIAMLTKNSWLAAIITLIGFAALHVPLWGWGFALGGLVNGIASMAFFLWRKDLLAMIVFHTSSDALGLIALPIFSEWWKQPSLF